LPGRFTDIRFKQSSGFRLEGEPKRIAQPIHPNRPIFSADLVEKRVVPRNRAVCVNAQDFPLKRIEVLRWQSGRLFAQRNVKFVVRSESKRTTLMAPRYSSTELGLVVAFQKNHFGRRIGGIAVESETGEHVMNKRPVRN